MTFEDIKAKRSEIEKQIAELQAKMAALDAVVEMFSNQPTLPPPPSNSHPSEITEEPDKKPNQKTLAGPSLLEAIRNSLGQLPDQFNVRYVRRALYKTKPEYTFLTSSISNALKRLADAGEIKLIMIGSGRRPSRYLKVRQNAH